MALIIVQSHLKVLLQNGPILSVIKILTYILLLPFYKVGTIDLYAKDGKNEWIDNCNIIRRQIESTRTLSNYDGFSLFRYDNLFNEEKFTNNSKAELEELKKIM